MTAVRSVRRRRAIVAGLLVVLGFAIAGHAATVQIDAAATHQLIRGFGGATVFMPTTPLTDGDLDTLFGNGAGQLGFTWLRIRVAPDDAWRAIELANARGARARGARVIATPWSPPAAMKTNASLIAGSLKTSAYADYATYLNGFARYMADRGAPLYAVSIQNEPDIAVTYESCDWTAGQLLDFCRSYAGAITATKIIMPESFQFRHAMSDPLLNDSSAADTIDIIGGHIYGGGLSPYPLAVAKGKEVWMTEHLDLSTDWAGALATGKEIHDCLAAADFSAYFWWYLRRFYGPLGEDSVVTKRGYVMAQFSKFVRPGFVRIDATANPSPGVYVSAFKRDSLVVVAINQAATAMTQVFSITGGDIDAVVPCTTSSTLNLETQPPLPVSAGTFTATLPAGSITTFVGELRFAPPSIVVPPQSHVLAPGSTVVLDVDARGEGIRYQWTRNGEAIPGATERQLTLHSVSATEAADFAVIATNSGGSATSAAATVRLANATSRLINISMRSHVGTGDSVQIAGFVIDGTAPKQVLVRAAGPALNASFGLTGVLDDPTIELRDGNTGEIVATNDNWDSTLEATFGSVGAFGWQGGSKDAAILVSLPPGPYTAVVRGHGDATGLAIVEVYEADNSPASQLINLSARSFVGAGDDLQIGGFVLGGDVARTVVIRATGPSLRKAFRMSGTLTDPLIELRKLGADQVLATSDDWPSLLAPHFDRVGAFPWLDESRDAAIVTTLEPGAYSILVRGKANATGTALIEIYAEP